MGKLLDAKIIPFLEDSADFEQNMTLGKAVFYLRFKYNVRDQGWYLNIFDKEQVPVLLSRKLTVNPLLDILQYTDEEIRPKGVLIVSSSDLKDAVTKENIGNKIQLIFISDESLLS